MKMSPGTVSLIKGVTICPRGQKGGQKGGQIVSGYFSIYKGGHFHPQINVPGDIFIAYDILHFTK